MSSPDRFSDNRYKNWLKCGLALIVMKEGLHQHVHNQVQTLHNYLISKVSPLLRGASATLHCGVCTWRDIKYDRHNKLWHMNCSKNICNVWLGEIIAVHKTPSNPKINWWNCDVSQWPSDPYQVAKAFMPNGQANVTKLPDDLDPPAILSLLYYCSFLCKNVPNTQILHDLIEVRNSLFHSGNFYVEDLEKDTWINNMLQLLQDLKLNGKEIEKIKREDLDINFREKEIKVLNALVSTLNSDLKTMYAAWNIKINSVEDCQKEQEEKIGKLQVCCAESTVKVVTMETKMKSFEKFTQVLFRVKTFFDNNSDILNHDLKNEIKNIEETVNRHHDCIEILKTKQESTSAELTSIRSGVEGVEDLRREVLACRVDLEKVVRKQEILSELLSIPSVVDKCNGNKMTEEKSLKSPDQTLGDTGQQPFLQYGMPAAWDFTKEEIDRAWVTMEGVLVEDLEPSYVLSSLTFLSDNECQAIRQMESRVEMAKMLLCRVKEQLPDAFFILLNTLKKKGPEQLVEKLVKIIKGTYISNYGKEQGMRYPTEKGGIYHQIPEYYRTLSQRISNILDVIGYSQEDRDRKIRCATAWECFHNMRNFLGTDASVNEYLYGSRCDGSTGPGLQSCIDMLYENNGIKIVTDLSQCQPNKHNFLMVHDDRTHPGYVKIQLVKILPDNTPVPVMGHHGQFYRVDSYGRTLFSNQCINGMVPHGPAVSQLRRHGPAISGYTFNTIFVIRCPQCSDDMHEWFQRRRIHGWPKTHYIKNAQKYGCFVTAVGHPHSTEQDLEWRLKFCFTERDLTRSFEDTTMKVYMLLKMIKKTYIQPILAVPFSSYYCKVCMLWVRERTPTELWRTENLLYCLTLCIKQLYEWACAGYCPDYFIIKNNIYDRRIFGATRHTLTKILETLVSKDYRALFRIECCNLGQLLMRDCSKLDSIHSKEIISTNQETRMDYTLSVQAALYCRLNMLRYIPQEYNILTRYIRRIMHALQYAPHTLRSCLHYVLMIFLSQLGFCVVSVCKQNALSLSQEEINYLVAFASRCLSHGINSDATSVRLKLCGLGIMLGDHDRTEISLQRISDHKMRYMFLSKFGALYMLNCNRDFNLHKLCTERYSIEELLQNQMSFPVVYCPSEISMAPFPMRMEMFRSVGAPLAVRDEREHFWYDWAVIDSHMCLYFFQYLNFLCLGKERHQQVALDNMLSFIRTEKDMLDGDMELNLLGYCFMRESRLRDAFISFYESLKMCPHHNAAKFYLGILFHKIHIARLRQKLKRPD